ncbi:hypothetical protein QVD17_32240 [Tagetes erecta]|uniref:Uncharacterized protein n=1 Tax=Tagetes erecta TaxID=13708 RepID=A0AAD8NP99_TARER|nr:hypothetical protein QVD17_32240 [Tagetes erecta]
MSRCFTYPPPGYCRNGATYEALIESIKLQKETDKAKTERRKEKRAKKEKKEKKDKEKKKRKNDEKEKLQNNQIQDSHKLQKVAGFTESQIKGTKTNTELLEKSDLTEECGQPIKPCYSSDSTQNSNKRRRDDSDGALLLDDSAGHGKPLKILILKKHKGSDSSKSGEDVKLKSFSSVPQSSSLDRAQPVSNNRNNGVPATSGRENNGVQAIPLTQTKSHTIFERTQINNSNVLGRDQPVSTSSAKHVLPSGSRKSDAELLKSSRQQQQIANFVRPVLPQSQHEISSSSLSRKSDAELLKSSRQQQQIANFIRPVLPQSQHEISSSSLSRKSDPELLKSSRQQQQIAKFVRPVLPQSQLQHEIPSSSASRNIGIQGPKPGPHQQGTSDMRPRIPDPASNKTNPSATGKRPISEITVPSNSGLPKAEKKKEDPHKEGPSRHEKKLLKKQAKYEKLLGSWAPSVLQTLLPVDNDDDDWLSPRPKSAKSTISRGEVETCREVAPASLWQPRAHFLAEADMHALPYTVPF